MASIRHLLASSALPRACAAAAVRAGGALAAAAAGLAPGPPPAPRAPAAAAALTLLRGFAAAPAASAPAAAADPAALDAAPPPPPPPPRRRRQGLLADATAPLFDLDRRPVGSVVLPGDAFDAPVRRDLLHRVVRWQLARAQAGTHAALTRAQVRGGGRKPWKQKGSGRARAGTTRAPHWRGGGAAHGPVPRSHAHSLPKRVRRAGLAAALSARAAEGRLTVVDELAPADGRTATLSRHLDALLAGAPRRSALLVGAWDGRGEPPAEALAAAAAALAAGGGGDAAAAAATAAVDAGVGGYERLRRGAGNLPWVDVLPARGLNVYSILRRDHLVMSAAAVREVVARLRRPVRPWSPRDRPRVAPPAAAAQAL